MFNLNPVAQAFLFFLFCRYAVQAYLDMRNKTHIQRNRKAVPEMFSDAIGLEDHQKAADYSVAKIKEGEFFNIIDLGILLAWTFGGGLNYLDTIVRGFGFDQIWTGVSFFLIFGAISTLIGLPQSIYHTFVLEEKYGFNKTTAKTFIVDMIKGLVIGGIIGIPLLYGLLWIMEALGENWWLYAWAFLTAFQLILLWAYPTFIAPIFNKFTELEEGEVKNKIIQLLERTGFTSKGLFVMDASRRSAHGNAYFTGFGKNKRIVFFDTLIKTLEADEVEAVLAHELGHFKKKHVMKMLIKSMIFSLIGLGVLGALMKWNAFYEGHGADQASTYMALLLFSLVSGVYTFFLTPINSWTSRKHEFEADTFASENSDANKLISALVKMYKDNASTLTPDPMYSNFYHSHPPALIRVEFLQSLINKK
jgi:STE24 endopeptidase